MARGDDLLSTIEAVHAAGLEEERWPDALARIANLFGARAASLEDFEKQPMRLCYLRTAGVPPQGEIDYLGGYAENNSRAKYAFQNLSKPFLSDYDFTDERAMDCDPYYSKYLAPLDLRYFLSGQIVNSARHQAIVSIQRTRRQGHVRKSDVDLMRRLVPHVRHAFDLTMRLRSADGNVRLLESVLDWLCDGVAVIDGGGRLAYANEAFREIAGQADGIRLRRGAVEFASVAAHGAFQAAIAAILHAGTGRPHASTDFPVPRRRSAPYLVSVRPFAPAGREGASLAKKGAIVFVHEPDLRKVPSVDLLRQTFGLTAAEASLALALHSGVAPKGYAERHGVSLNTVYTHLRRLKEKTGCHRMSELTRKVGDMQARVLRRF